MNDYKETTIYEESRIYKYIVHLSDIHIRLNSRAEEYEHVFSNLYKKLDTYHDPLATMVVITGDIFHDKMNLSTQSLRLCLEFFYQLSNRFTTVIIRGNHDGMMDMNIRMDNISGVLYRRDFENLYYLKYSGIYQIGNILFGVSSLEDNIFIPCSLLDEYIISNALTKKFHKIALYHGMVGTISISRLYKAKGQYSVEDFANYDYVLLGDVHKYMYLDEKKKMGYPSSLISQSFTESDDYHGYILWDLLSSTSEYNIIQNNYRHKVCKVSDNKLYIDEQSFDVTINIETLSNHIPSNGMIRVDGWDDTIMRTLKSYYPNVHWMKNVKKITPSELSVKTKQNKIKFGSLQLDMKLLIKQCIKRNNSIDITNEQIEFIYTIINNEMRSNDLNSTNNSWCFQKLTFMNLCLYGGNKEQCLNLKSYGAGKVILLNGTNGMGKSSILDIICFVLYGKMARDVNMGMKRMAIDVLHINENSGYGELEFELNNTLFYKVRRVITKGSTGNHNVKSYLYQYENNEFKLILNVGEDINHFVEGIFGRYDDFLYLNMMRQFDNLSFRKMRQNERKELLVRLLNLDRYHKLETKYKAEYKKFYDECNYLNNDLNSINIVNLKESINKTEEEINKDKIILEDYEAKNKTLLETIMELDREYVTIDNTNSIDEKIVYEKRIELAILQNKIDNYKKGMIDLDNNHVNVSVYVPVSIKDESYITTLNDKMVHLMSQIKKKHLIKKKNVNDETMILHDYDHDHSILLNRISYLESLLQINSQYDIEKYDTAYRFYKKSMEKIAITSEISKGKETYIENMILYLYNNKSISQNTVTSHSNILDESLDEYNEKCYHILLKKHVSFEIEVCLLLKENNKRKDHVKEIETQWDELNVYVSKLKIVEDTILYKQSMYDQLIIYEYNENCDKCMKNPRLIERINVKEELDILHCTANSIKEKLLDYDNKKQQMVLCKETYDKKEEYIKRVKDKISHIKNDIVIIKYICDYSTLCKHQLEYDFYLYMKEEDELHKMMQIELDNLYQDRLCIIENENIEKENNKTQEEIEEIKSKIMDANKYIKYECELLKTRLEYERLYDYVEKATRQNEFMESNREIMKKRNILNEEIKKIELHIIKYKALLEDNIIKLHGMKDKLESYNEKTELYEIQKKNMKLYDYVVTVLGMNGINLDIIGEYLNSISVHVNDMLSLFMEHRIHLYLDGNDVMMRLINNDTTCFLDNMIPLLTSSKDEKKIKKSSIKTSLKKDGIPHDSIPTDIILVDKKRKIKIVEKDLSEKNPEISTNNHHNMMMLGGKDSVILDICMMYVLGMMGGINGNILLLDECLGVFDIHSMDKLEYMLNNMLHSYEYIIIISHSSRIHSMIHKTVYVRNDGKNSYLDINP